ncbi:MAG: protease complex subunit PrcB family protein [Eubacterium sp.]|nr:protease complex subunit PrcB family protein [Eubacterium sp.]
MALSALYDGCGIEKTDGSKINDLEYEMVEEENIPEELKTKIEEKKAADFKLTYESDSYIYVVRGYGEQETGGYSIQILEFYQTQNSVIFQTNLIGPSKDELKNAAPSYPYVVIRAQNPEKNILFK